MNQEHHHKHTVNGSIHDILLNTNKKNNFVLTPTFRSNSPTMLRAEILAEVVSRIPERLSPRKTTLLTKHFHPLTQQNA